MDSDWAMAPCVEYKDCIKMYKVNTKSKFFLRVSNDS